MDDDAFETAAYYFFTAMFVLSVLGWIATCIIFPLNGIWAPDIVTGGVGLFCAAFYGLYRIVKWTQTK
jgi:hypothetical protein